MQPPTLPQFSSLLLPIPGWGHCIPHCPPAPLLAAAGRRPRRGRSVRADPDRRAPAPGPVGPLRAFGAHPMWGPGRAQVVPSPQGAAGGRRAGRSGRVAGAGCGSRAGRGSCRRMGHPVITTVVYSPSTRSALSHWAPEPHHQAPAPASLPQQEQGQLPLERVPRVQALESGPGFQSWPHFSGTPG